MLYIINIIAIFVDNIQHLDGSEKTYFVSKTSKCFGANGGKYKVGKEKKKTYYNTSK